MAGRPENLKPVKTTEEAQARGKLGGLASGQVRKEKKLMSQIYAKILADGFLVDGQRIDSNDMMASVSAAILERKDSAAVAMMREIREATEGSKTTVDATVGVLSDKERKARIAELMARRNAVDQS